MIDLRRHPRGTTLPVRVQPGASTDRIVGEHDGALKVSITAPPERGRANAAIVRLLARTLEIRRNDIEILFGETNRDKQLLLAGISPEEVRKALSSLS